MKKLNYLITIFILVILFFVISLTINILVKEFLTLIGIKNTFENRLYNFTLQPIFGLIAFFGLYILNKKLKINNLWFRYVMLILLFFPLFIEVIHTIDFLMVKVFKTKFCYMLHEDKLLLKKHLIFSFISILISIITYSKLKNNNKSKELQLIFLSVVIFSISINLFRLSFSV